MKLAHRLVHGILHGRNPLSRNGDGASAGRRASSLAAALVACFALSSAARAEPGMMVEIVPVPAVVTSVEGTSRGSMHGTGAYVSTDADTYLVAPCPIVWCVDPTVPTEMEGPPISQGVPEQLPDGRVARGADGWLVWYAAPTEEYAHGVLGDAVEAKAIVVWAEAAARNRRSDPASPLLDGLLPQPKPEVFFAPGRAVFEDITPRLADLDGDGADEVVTVLSSRDGGASLAVYVTTYGRRLGSKTHEGRTMSGHVATSVVPGLIQAPPIGNPNRWLNPAAIHDFDGDGVLDVALVETPHIGGELQLWSGASLLAGEPEMLAARRGYSNHAIGSRALDLAEVVRIGGRDALVLPDATRQALVAVRYEDGEWVEIATVALPARALSGIAAVGRDLAVGLEDGTLARVVLTD